MFFPQKKTTLFHDIASGCVALLGCCLLVKKHLSCYYLRRPEADWYLGIWGAEPPRECANLIFPIERCIIPLLVSGITIIFAAWPLLYPNPENANKVDIKLDGSHGMPWHALAYQGLPLHVMA